ncbi:MAG: SPFH domain-containing protein [Candidatus Obscuribacterales bacterium]
MVEIVGGILVLGVMIVMSGVKMVKEHDRLVVFRFGRIIGARGQGLQYIIPFIDHSLLIDAREKILKTGEVAAVTRDGVPLTVACTLRLQVKDPVKAVSRAESPLDHALAAVTAALPASLSRLDSRKLSGDSGSLSGSLKTEMARHTGYWGVKIKGLELSVRTGQQDD